MDRRRARRRAWRVGAWWGLGVAAALGAAFVAADPARGGGLDERVYRHASPVVFIAVAAAFGYERVSCVAPGLRSGEAPPLDGVAPEGCVGSQTGRPLGRGEWRRLVREAARPDRVRANVEGRGEIVVVSAGWPLSCLRGGAASRGDGGVAVWGLLVTPAASPHPAMTRPWGDVPWRVSRVFETAERARPVGVLWVPALVNGAFFGVLASAIWGFAGRCSRGIRAWWEAARTRGGRLCPRCRYDLLGELRTGCPECGWNRAG